MPHHGRAARHNRSARKSLAERLVSTLRKRLVNSHLVSETKQAASLGRWGQVGNMRGAVRSQSSVKVHVASKDALINAGLRQMLRSCSFISVTGTSTDDAATVSALTTEIPDVLVLSASSERDVYAVVQAARSVSEALKIVVLADEALAAHLVAARQARLEGILVRGGDGLQDLGAALRIVHHGGQVTSRYDEARQNLGPQLFSADVAARLRSLSARESTIVREVANGRTNAEIAKPLHVSVATIKADLARIMTSMKLSSRVDLAVLAVRSGFTDQPVPLPVPGRLDLPTVR